MSNGSVTELRQTMARAFLQRHPTDAARLLDGRPVAETLAVLDILSPADAAAILDRLAPNVGADVLRRLDSESARKILPQMDLRRAAAFSAQLDERARESLLGALDRVTAREIRELMTYPADSAGALMDPHVNAFRSDTAVREVLRRLRRLGQRRIVDVFVIDDQGRLVGATALEDLVLAPATAALASLENRGAVGVSALATRDEVVETFEAHKLATLPVLDAEGRLLGVLRYDTLVAAAEAEATVGLQTMVGASREERALSTATFAVRKRLPWLEINLLTAFLAAAVVGVFEDTIARFTALAVLLPVVAGQSGNTGAQALAVTMRGLTLREIRVRQWRKVVFKEARVGLMTGLAVALTTGTAVLVWSQSIGLTMVIGISMVISMLAAALAGALIPMVLTSLGQDPAQSSSIVLTTVTDVVGFFSFLGIATMFSGFL